MVPWTHTVRIGKNERIVSASLSLSIRQQKSGSAAAGSVCFGDLARKRSFKEAALVTEWPSTTVLCFDLNEQLATLELGTLNVAVANGFAVDWAVLELAVADVPKTTNSDR
jgi:hypothetical protein